MRTPTGLGGRNCAYSLQLLTKLNGKRSKRLKSNENNAIKRKLPRLNYSACGANGIESRLLLKQRFSSLKKKKTPSLRDANRKLM